MGRTGANGGIVDRTAIAEVSLRLGDLLRVHRRWIAAGLAGVAVITGISAMEPHPLPSTAIWVAARDLDGGTSLARSDLTVARLPSDAVPAGALPAGRSPAGQLLAAPVRRGEPLTDVRLLSPALLANTGDPAALAVPVRVSDGAAALALVRSGDAVDVIATNDTAGAAATATRVVEDVRVLAVPHHSDVDGGGLLIVAATAAQATALAQIPIGNRVSVALRRTPAALRQTPATPAATP